MPKNDSSASETSSSNQKRSLADYARPFAKLGKVFLIGLAVILVFSTGVAVGNGSLSVGGMASQNKDLPNSLDYSSVDYLYRSLKNKYDGKLTEQQMLDGIKAGLAEATGDPYTEYFNQKDSATFNEQLTGSFSGIGAELGQDTDKNLIVVAPIDGFPADKAGLRAQDIITTIDGKSTSGMSIDDAVSKIRGPKNTKVTLEIVRGKTQKLTFSITRADIKIPSVKHEILDGNIGYLRITQFRDDTAALAEQAAREFKDNGVDGVILDVRDNPGGLLESSVSVASLWLPTGTKVLDEKRGGEVIDTYVSNGKNVLDGVPTVVLINNGSASASEIVAGALKDNGVATLVGEKTFGKGSVQQLVPSRDGGQLKVTVARWFRPNGQNIDKKGIEADKKVSLSEDDYKNDRDPQKDVAITILEKE